jgi:hypothetical protein
VDDSDENGADRQRGADAEEDAQGEGFGQRWRSDAARA